MKDDLPPRRFRPTDLLIHCELPWYSDLLFENNDRLALYFKNDTEDTEVVTLTYNSAETRWSSNCNVPLCDGLSRLVYMNEEKGILEPLPYLSILNILSSYSGLYYCRYKSTYKDFKTPALDVQIGRWYHISIDFKFSSSCVSHCGFSTYRVFFR